MKNLFIIILSVSFCYSLFAQDPILDFSYESYYDSTWKDYPESMKKSTGINYAPYGEVFTPKGTIRTLIIFAKFTNDMDQPCGNWSYNADAPDFVNPVNASAPDLIFSSTNEFSLYANTDNRSLSKYYNVMSSNQFNFLGDILSNSDGTPHCFEIDPTSNNPDFQTNATGWNEINKRVMTKMKQDFPNFDWSPYDLHENKPLYRFDASATGPDNKPDYVIICYRYSNDWNTQPVSGMNTWQGSKGGYSVLDGLSSITYNGYTFDRSGYTNCTGGYDVDSYVNIMSHEIAHELYSCPHIMGANSAFGNRWTFPKSGWGLMKSSSGVQNISANGWERWLLGWIELNCGSPSINTDIKSESDLLNGGIYTVRDFITTGDVLRIRIPHTTNTYLWIENHQLLSSFDHKKWAGKVPSIDGEEIPEISAGLYMYLENILDDRNLITPNMVYDLDKVNGIKILNAQGNYDYWHSPLAPDKTWDYFWNNSIFTYKRKKENPISGLNPYYGIPDDYPNVAQVPGSDGTIKYIQSFNGGNLNHEAYSIVRETDDINTIMTYSYLGGTNMEASIILGRRSDVFLPGDEISLSGIIPALNYPKYDKSNYKIEPNILNGLKVEVLSYNQTSKEMEIEVSFDDYSVRDNKRWCGYIELLDNTGDSDPDLILEEGNCLELDKNGNANRHTKHPVYDDFINPSVFTIKTNAKFDIESSSDMIIKNNSALVIESGSTIDIGHDSKILVKDGSTMQINNGASINIVGSGYIDIEDGAYFCLENGVNISLQDILSSINLHSGYISGTNTSVIPNPGTCLLNPTSISVSGNGSIHDQYANDLYIQNESISTDEYYVGLNIYSGSNVTASLSPGPVRIINGASVVFDAEEDVNIEGEFEVELGSTFEVR